MVDTRVFHFRSFCTLTPSSLNSVTLSSAVPPMLTGVGDWARSLKTYPHVFGLFGIQLILFFAAQPSRWFIASCMWLLDPRETSSYWLQSSAYLQVGTSIPLVIQSSMSLTCTLNIVGEITPPCGTPAITEPVLERTPGSLTCCVLLVRKLWHHFQNDLLTPIPASFVSKIPWSTKSKALQKSTNNACTPLNELP